MAPIHVILHPTDFSAQAADALRLACSLARDYVARLVVLHVAEGPPVGEAQGVLVPPTPGQAEAEARAELQRLQVPIDDVRAERRLEQGEAVREILRVAAEIRADLIVMGTHGRTGLSRALMGSVAEQV